MNRTTRRQLVALTVALVAAGPAAAAGVNVRDICRLDGARENQLMAVSLVVGLDGTGDGSSLETLRSLAYMLERFNHSGVNLAGLNADNVALVHVTATIGPGGARNGAKLDVRVSAINGAKSLVGGRLVQCQMLGPMATPVAYALAAGEVALEDPSQPTVGVIKGGAVMERDVVPTVVRRGRIRLLLDDDHDEWAIASSIATVINDAEAPVGPAIATATAAGEVVVSVPTAELADPAGFIARVLDLPVLMPDLKARIIINRKTGTIVITGDVQIDPVTFTHNGMVINTLPPDELAEAAEAAGAAPPPTTVRQLTNAFNQLQVPAADQIAIIWAIKEAGLLHADVEEM